jgi:hypothetical protein
VETRTIALVAGYRQSVGSPRLVCDGQKRMRHWPQAIRIEKPGPAYVHHGRRSDQVPQRKGTGPKSLKAAAAPKYLVPCLGKRLAMLRPSSGLSAETVHDLFARNEWSIVSEVGALAGVVAFSLGPCWAPVPGNLQVGHVFRRCSMAGVQCPLSLPSRRELRPLLSRDPVSSTAPVYFGREISPWIATPCWQFMALLTEVLAEGFFFLFLAE